MRQWGPLFLLLCVAAVMAACGDEPEGPHAADVPPEAPVTEPDVEPPALDTVVVSTVGELIAAIAPDTHILLKPGDYDFSALTEKEIQACGDSVTPVFLREGILSVSRAPGLILEAEEPGTARLLTKSEYAEVVTLYQCDGAALRGLVLGHISEDGTCDASVLRIDSSQGITIEDCGLFGGTCGIWAYSDCNLTVTGTEIYNGVFSRDVKATMNGQTARVISGAGTENLTVSYTFPALATEQQEEITQVDLAVDSPEAGKTPGAATVIGDADQYEIWNNWDPPVNMFEAGGTYTVEVHLTAKNGAFSRNVKATMNGQTATVTEGAGTENLTVSYTFPALPGQTSDDTDVVAIIGIDVPVAGAAPDRTAEAESPNHIVTNVQWSPGDSKFVAGKEYTVNVTVKGDGNHRFPSWSKVKATVNGQEATIVSGTGTSEIRVHYTFTALEAEPDTCSPSPMCR